MNQGTVISEIISEITENKNVILSDHSMHDTAHMLENFEKLVQDFDKHDRRKDETEEIGKEYRSKRDSNRNTMLAVLIDTMKNKVQFFEQELNVARNIQQHMVPQRAPKTQGYDIQGFYQPSRQVGGDYYDFFYADDGKLYFVISDVSGKGIPSSLVVASMQAFLHAEINNRKPLKRLLNNLNNYLTETLANEKYVTFFIGSLNLSAGHIRYINAGHNPPYIIKSKAGKIKTLEKGGPILGLFENASYRTGSATLSSGDMLALFTDGIVEAFNDSEEEFSDERLVDIIKREYNKPIDDVMETILGELKAFCGDRPLGDDITIMLIRKQ